jgi:hypothetical protein
VDYLLQKRLNNLFLIFAVQYKMYKFALEVEKAKSDYEKAAMVAMTSRLDYLYNYEKNGNVEEKKADYIRKRDDYKRLKLEFDSLIAVPNEWEKTGLSMEALQKATIHLPVDGKTTAFKVVHDMEERLWRSKYVVPAQGSVPAANTILWVDV